MGYVKEEQEAARVITALRTIAHPYSCTEITTNSIYCVCKLRVQQGVLTIAAENNTPCLNYTFSTKPFNK
jgi:hypothetical protein